MTAPPNCSLSRQCRKIGGSLYIGFVNLLFFGAPGEIRTPDRLVRSMPIRLTPKNTMGSILAWSNLFQRPCWNSSAYSLMNGRAATTWSKSAGPLVLFAAGAANRVKHTASRIDQWFCGATSANETPPSRREPLCTRLAHRCKYGSGERTLCRRRRLGCRRCSSSASLG